MTPGRPLAEVEPLLSLMARRLYPVGAPDRVVVASVVFQTVTKHLVRLALGPPGGVPAFDAVRWCGDGTGIRVDAVGPGLPVVAPGSEERVGMLVEGVFRPWVEVVRGAVRVGERLLWADATASVLYAATSPAVPLQVGGALAALARHVPGGLLATIDPPGNEPAFRRLACCLIDRAPGHERCGECPLRRQAGSAPRLRTIPS